MGTYKDFIATIDNLLNEAQKNKIIRLETKNGHVKNNIINLGKGDVTHFGSCSYLGLEFNKEMKSSSISAIQNYGTQFSSSRAYLSIDLYQEYESLLSKIFDAHAVVTPTTTLGHIAAIPNQVGDNDAVILDHQVHNSVQNAVNLLKFRNINVETLKHNDMDMLEERIKILLGKNDQVWYMADGIYSMYGDGLPAQELETLLNKYKNFRLYVDDAHGMSWAGKNGRGYTLSKMNLHPQMILATSLNKSFASGGGVLVFPTKEQADLIRNCAGPLVTSGPLQPANIGAGIAAAKIHLSDEIYKLQDQLLDNIKYTNLLLQNSNLPAVFNSETPIFFIGTSLPKIAYKIIQRMQVDGFFVNLGIFPAVPMKNTGVRFTITKLHTFDQIEGMINSLEKNYFEVINEEKFDIENIYKAFNIENKKDFANKKLISELESYFNIKTEHYKSIKEIKKSDWDKHFINKGNFDWNGLKILEDSFSKNELMESNWEFDYLIIRNNSNEIILATFFTTALSKDDMLAPESISSEIELERIKNPHYLTSRTLFMGSLFSEGEHLYLDTTSNLWKAAMNLFFEKVNEIKNNRNAVNVVLRDFINITEELNSIFIDNGYYKSKMPNNNVIEDLSWDNENEFLNNLSSNSRRQVRKHIFKHKTMFETNIIETCEKDTKTKLWYHLYQNVKSKNLSLNTFNLPYKLFKKISKDKSWDKIELILNKKVVAVIFCYKNGETYNPMLIGLDYNNDEYSFYRQSLYQVIRIANENNFKKINFGFSADIEKKRLGAKSINTISYISTDDTLNQTIMTNISASKMKLELSYK